MNAALKLVDESPINNGQLIEVVQAACATAESAFVKMSAYVPRVRVSDRLHAIF
jgi:hypothetical protein